MRGFGLLLMLLVLPMSAARADLFESAVVPGDVIKGHAKYEKECEKCHKRFDKDAQTDLCKDCHKEVAQDIRARKGLHGHLENDECRKCHTDHKGRDAKIAPFDKAHFDHAQTGFLLKDKHAGVKCDKCHEPTKKYRDASRECDSCHHKDDAHKGKLGAKCQNCHDAKDWKKAQFDHEKTEFPLAGGKHEDVKCKECHADKLYKDTRKECVACHRKDDEKDGHKGRYGTKCESCHTDRGWKELKFDHDRDTKFDLRGKHRPVKCEKCHEPAKGDLYKQNLSMTCVSCHRDDDMKKGHKGSQGDKCETCHNEKSWDSTDFDHDRKTDFPLKGKHKDAKCSSCHKDRIEPGKKPPKLDTKCVACHQDDDMKKGHKEKYGKKCETCHTEQEWKKTIFDHKRDTKYPLIGNHADVKCVKCHAPEKPLYGQNLSTICYSCHKKDDKHEGQLGKKCEDCHKETSKWDDTPYDHNRSAFPLTGSHMRVECKKCHKTPAFKDAETTCVSCHQKDDAKVHKKRLGPKCDDCHNTRIWRTWNFDHDTRTKYKLDGEHTKVACEECHRTPVEGKFNVSTSCISCHSNRDVHDGGFGQMCERCHVTESFAKIKDGAIGFAP